MLRSHSAFSLLVILLLVSCAPAAGSITPIPVQATMPPEIPSALPPAPTPTSTPALDLDAFTAARSIGRGVNLGNALEAPAEGEWGVTLHEEYFELIRQAGFNSVRIPIRWDSHAAQDAPYTIDPEYFKRIDQVVSWALDRELVTIINFHHYGDLMTNPDGHEARYQALWQQVAVHYKDYPSTLFFELLNEPNDQLTAQRWNVLLTSTLGIVRKSNPTRNIIIGGVGWNAFDQLQNLQLPVADQNIIATFHYYTPFEFTHQGAEWAADMDKYLGTTWTASDSEKSVITSQFDVVAAWTKEHNRPVLLGEFGAYSKADMDSRARWTAFIAREAEKRGFAWTYWEFCAGFGIYDPRAKQWREPLRRALIP